MRVLGPGVGAAALGNHRAEMRVGQHVRPRRRRGVVRAQHDDVLAAVGAEAAVWIAQLQAARVLYRRRQQRRRDGRRAVPRLARLEARHMRFHPAPADLFGQRAAGVGEDNARAGLDQNAVLAGELLRRAHEDAAGTIEQARFAARSDQAHDLVLQLLPVTGAILVPDHQIHRQTLQAPIGVCLHQLTDQFDPRRVGDLQQHDG